MRITKLLLITAALLMLPTGWLGMIPDFHVFAQSEQPVIPKAPQAPDATLDIVFFQAATEGNPGGTAGTIQFQINLVGPFTPPVTVRYRTTTGGTAAAGIDYTPMNGSHTFNTAGTHTVSVQVIPDLIDEPPETVVVEIYEVIGQVNQGEMQATGTINDDDLPPLLQTNPLSIPEGNSGTSTRTLQVSLSRQSGYPVSVDYATAPGTAVEGNDYSGASGMLTFNPGDISKNITLSALGDEVDEDNENFFVNFSNPSRLDLTGNESETITITDDDTAGIIVSPSDTVNNRLTTSENGDKAEFTVRLASKPTGNVTIDLSSSEATEGRITSPSPAALVFTPDNWNNQRLVEVTGEDDDVYDQSQNYQVALDVRNTTNDPKYSGLPNVIVYFKNLDNEGSILFLSMLSEKQYYPFRYMHTFDTPDSFSGWRIFADPGQAVQYGIQSAKLLLRHTKANENVKVVAPPSPLTFAYEVEVEASLTGANTDTNAVVGIIFDFLDERSFYRFRILPAQQKYSIQKFQNGWVNVYPAAGWSDVKTQINPAGVNRLKVQRDGSQIKVFVNSFELATVTDATYIQGGAGLIIVTSLELPDGSMAEAAFDNFVIRQLPD